MMLVGVWSIDNLLYILWKSFIVLVIYWTIINILIVSLILLILLIDHIFHVYTLADKEYRVPINTEDIVLITGASSGLGKSVMDQMISKKVKKIIIIDKIRPDQEYFNDHCTELLYYQCDLSDKYSISTIMAKILEDLNEREEYITICINNAGIRGSGSLLSMDDRDFRSVLEVNTLSHVYIMKKVLQNYVNFVIPTYGKHRISVVSVASALGYVAPRDLSAYSASKAAIIQVHEALRKELSNFLEIRLLLITTGQLTSNMFRDVIPPREFLAPIINHVELAKKMVEKIDIGQEGSLSYPLYAKFLPLLKIMPLFIQDICRKFSKMDEQI
ncbi:Piso0_002607 [Millerozyma farinosa CBS 7064]|uniref:Piso0_002607 protein n=1 Tax=Pichia sorbitophila (strain ATCC MYA-4447 / BCRC 22081 / CBS 7064 / NBRC 10061 / NRRL Y-12695) TaxID=559304 RepID=G8YD25_PICSO|nr:Piso0_002607 [Millerozyma farinosa CBS 7064]